MDLKVLEDLGLTKSEISVYFSLLELGPSRTGPLAVKASVARSKIYELLEKLAQKGLVSFAIRENTKYFSASDPLNLKEYLEHKKKELKSQEDALQALLPGLIEIQKLRKEKQSATVFEGYKGIRTVFNDVLQTLKKGDEYCAFATGMESYTPEFSAFIMNYHKRREAKGIRVRLLANENIKNRVLSELGEYKHMQFRFTNEKSPTSTLIYKDKLFLFTWKNPSAILIESKEIAQQYREHFLDIWERAKE